MTGFEWLQPDGLSLGLSLLLVVSSAATSLLTAAMGIGGGIALLAIMATLLPVVALIPVHGAVQIGSNAGRMLIMLREVRASVFLPFALGSVAGAAIGGAMAIRLAPSVLQIGLACFILWTAWGRPPRRMAGGATITLTGLVSAFLTMFFGATGPFVAAMIKTMRLDRLTHVATHSACMVAQHGIKVATFGLLGFAYGPYLPLIALMVVSGFVGTLIGKRVLLDMTDQRFHHLLSWVLTLLALRLLWTGLAPIIGDAIP